MTKPDDRPDAQTNKTDKTGKSNLPARIDGRLSGLLTTRVSVQSLARGSAELAMRPIKALAGWYRNRNMPLEGEPDGKAIRDRHPAHEYVLYNSDGNVLMLSNKAPLKTARDEGIALDGLSMCRRNLPQRRYSHISLNKADFRRATITETDFVECALIGARFEGAVLGNVCFEAANLRGADFTGVRLTKDQGVDFAHADLTGATFSADFPFHRCRMTGATIANIKLVDTAGNVLEGARLSADGDVVFAQGAAAASAPAAPAPTPASAAPLVTRAFMRRRFALDHTREDLTARVLKTHYQEGRIFDRASFRDAEFLDMRCNGSSFRDADFSNATIKYSEFQRGDFRGADLRGATFEKSNKGYYVEFQGGKFAGAKFSINAEFSACDFHNADLSGALLCDKYGNVIKGATLGSDGRVSLDGKLMDKTRRGLLYNTASGTAPTP